MAQAVLFTRLVVGRARNGNAGDHIDILVYLLWAAVLLVLLRYV